jgi:predicted enzyme related to lactoylglutathione lyase
MPTRAKNPSSAKAKSKRTQGAGVCCEPICGPGSVATSPAADTDSVGEARLDLIQVCVNDFKTMVEFYRDKLGLRMTNEGDRFAIARSKSGAVIALRADRDRPNGRHWLLEFEVQDIEKCVTALKSRGLKVGPIITETGCGRVVELKDPEGNMIGLVEHRTC